MTINILRNPTLSLQPEQTEVLAPLFANQIHGRQTLAPYLNWMPPLCSKCVFWVITIRFVGPKTQEPKHERKLCWQIRYYHDALHSDASAEFVDWSTDNG